MTKKEIEQQQYKEAEYFAYCLLMPEGLLMPELKKLDATVMFEDAVGILAKQFKVTSEKMAIRLTQLGVR